MAGIRGGFRFDDDLRETFEAIDDNWPRHRSAILQALGEDLVGNLKRDIPTSSGTAKSTVRTINTESGGPGEVVAGGKRGVNYIEPLLTGTDPHAPGSPNPAENTSLARWARRNGYPGGFEAIYRSIYHYGTDEHDFVTQPVADTQARAGDIAERVLERRGVFDR
ncbi:hypothetical protein [Haloarcula sp. 1CSR25-25]|uniref:hypothetical protein n=1 Tax=Haloarcula sp. 1CSR25-25 TaxID=2862545 RepID=UPI0028939016|nr:hypothetical protein [Haloarcula sp. 1CSR25-25]MDT3434689.1 hypothetical protein [Haloarcula sp. 1CSR25-25]